MRVLQESDCADIFCKAIPAPTEASKFFYLEKVNKVQKQQGTEVTSVHGTLIVYKTHTKTKIVPACLEIRGLAFG